MSSTHIHDKTTTYSLRISEELKKTCEDIAERKNISLNEWIKRTLLSAVDEIQDGSYQEIMRGIDEYVSKPNPMFVTSRRKFIKEACAKILLGKHCPTCGGANPLGSNYCNFCGKLIQWESPLQKYAVAYFKEYKLKYPLPTGWEYALVVPSEELPEAGFAILRVPMSPSDTSRPVIVKELSSEDIEEGERLYLEDNEKEVQN